MTPEPSLVGKNTLRPGVGTLIGNTPLGFFISNPRSGMSFNSPFRPVLMGNSVRFAFGVVDGFEPTIGGKPISGGGGALPPMLELRTSEISSTNESWAVLEVTPNADGVLDKNSKIEIVHRNSPTGQSTTIGRQALALIVWRNKLPVAVWPQVFFNLRYQQTKSATAGVRHFFL